jgi:hypothetical protein
VVEGLTSADAPQLTPFSVDRLADRNLWLRYTVTTSCPSIPAAWPAWLAPVNHARIVNRGVYA